MKDFSRKCVLVTGASRGLALNARAPSLRAAPRW